MGRPTRWARCGHLYQVGELREELEELAIRVENFGTELVQVGWRQPLTMGARP